MVSTYLVHHGYCATAEAFANGTGQVFDEEITSIKNRQRILKLVLAGRMGEAIETTSRLYPGLLEHNLNLLFMLKCRQFVEMVNGSDSEVRCSRPHLSSTPPHPSVIQSTKAFNGNSSSSSNRVKDSVEEMNIQNIMVGVNGTSEGSEQNGLKIKMEDSSSDDVEMETPPPPAERNGHTNGYQNGTSMEEAVEDMEVDPPRQLCGGSKTAVERMLEFGRSLYLMSQRLMQEQGKNENNKKMLQDAFSLLAYSNPWSSPVGWQLEPVQREAVCAALNSAILESSQLPRRAPLEVCVAHARELVNTMSRAGLGSCAFTCVDDLLQH